MCPMLRVARRAGILSNAVFDPHYDVPKIIQALTDHLGAPFLLTSFIATGTSAAQLASFSSFHGFFVNLDKLYKLPGISHASGFTFDGDSTTVSTVLLNETMTLLRELQDENGHLLLEDLQQVKDDIAEVRDVNISIISNLEIGFVWSTCGGELRGFVETTDVERFLNGRLPLTTGAPSIIF